MPFGKENKEKEFTEPQLPHHAISERPNAVHVRIFRTITYRTYGRAVLAENCRTPYIISVHLLPYIYFVLHFYHVRTLL